MRFRAHQSGYQGRASALPFAFKQFKNKLCYPLPLKILISHAFSQLCFLFAANGWQTVALAVP
jgi:hypothetical protein